MLLRAALLAGLAAVAIPAASFAAPAPGALHLERIVLPGGGIATIRYAGRVPPTLTVAAPDGALPAAFLSWGGFAPVGIVPSPWALPSPASLMRTVAAVMDGNGAPAMPGMAAFAPDDAAATFPAALLRSPDACVVATRVVEAGNGAPTFATFRSEGCGPATGTVAPGARPARMLARPADPVPAPRLIEASLPVHAG